MRTRPAAAVMVALLCAYVACGDDGGDPLCEPGTVLQDGACVPAGSGGMSGSGGSGGSPDSVAPTFAGCARVETVALDEIRVHWAAGEDDVSAADQITYDIYVSETPGGQDFSTPAASVTGAESGEVTGLSAETDYYFVCRARDQAGNQDDNSVELKGVTNVVPPTFTGLLTLDNPTLDSFEVTWAAATDDVTAPEDIVYDIYAGASSGSQDFITPIASSEPGATSHVVTPLANGTLYFVVVRARDEAGNHDNNEIEDSLRTLIAYSQIQAVFDSPCATCHINGAAAPLQLDMSNVYLSWTNLCEASGQFASTTCTPVPSEQHTTQNRIEPGSPSTSWLYRKISNTHATAPAECVGNFCGEAMPHPLCGCGLLSGEQIALFEDWILQGAERLSQ